MWSYTFPTYLHEVHRVIFAFTF